MDVPVLDLESGMRTNPLGGSDAVSLGKSQLWGRWQCPVPRADPEVRAVGPAVSPKSLLAPPASCCGLGLGPGAGRSRASLFFCVSERGSAAFWKILRFTTFGLYVFTRLGFYCGT